MTNPVFMIQLVEDQTDYFNTVIKVHKTGGGCVPHTVLFGGDAMWQWDAGACANADGSTDHVRSHGQNINWAEWLHNGLSGMHTTILHAGFDEFCVHDKHEDYPFVARLFELSLLPDAKVLELTGGVIPETCK